MKKNKEIERLKREVSILKSYLQRIESEKGTWIYIEGQPKDLIGRIIEALNDLTKIRLFKCEEDGIREGWYSKGPWQLFKLVPTFEGFEFVAGG